MGSNWWSVLVEAQDNSGSFWWPTLVMVGFVLIGNVFMLSLLAALVLEVDEFPP